MISTSAWSGAGAPTSAVTVTGSGRGIRTLVEPVGTSHPGGRSGSGTVPRSSTRPGPASGAVRAAGGGVRLVAGAGSGSGVGATTGAGPGADVVVDETAGAGADGAEVVRVGTGCVVELPDGTTVARTRGATEAVTVPVPVTGGLAVATTAAVGALLTADGSTWTCPGRSRPPGHTTPTTPAATTAPAATTRTARLPKIPPVE